MKKSNTWKKWVACITHTVICVLQEALNKLIKTHAHEVIFEMTENLMENNEFLWHEHLSVCVCSFSSGYFVSFLFSKIASKIYSSFVLYVSFCVSVCICTSVKLVVRGSLTMCLIHFSLLKWGTNPTLLTQYEYKYLNGATHTGSVWHTSTPTPVVLHRRHLDAHCYVRMHHYVWARAAASVFCLGPHRKHLVLAACIEPAGHCAHVVWVLQWISFLQCNYFLFSMHWRFLDILNSISILCSQFQEWHCSQVVVAGLVDISSVAKCPRKGNEQKNITNQAGIYWLF